MSSDRNNLHWWTRAAIALRRERLVRRVRTHTVVSHSKLHTLHALAGRIEEDGTPGIVVECGVFRGGSAALLAATTAADRQVYLFDSFQGLPRPGEKDGAQAHRLYREGWCHGTVPDVQSIGDRVGVDRGRVHFVEGWFEQTLPAFVPRPIALLHIDADWYESVKLCLSTFWDHVSPGGFVAFDDYGRWEGCTRAVDEFLDTHGLTGLLVDRHYLVKPPARPEEAPACK